MLVYHRPSHIGQRFGYYTLVNTHIQQTKKNRSEVSRPKIVINPEAIFSKKYTAAIGMLSM